MTWVMIRQMRQLNMPFWELRRREVFVLAQMELVQMSILVL